MSSLLHRPPSVQPTLRVFDPDELPPDDGPFFEPTPKEEAWDLGYRLARDGEISRYGRMHTEYGTYTPDDVQLSFMAGRSAGHKAREVKEAFDQGYSAGYSGSISDPPKGLSSKEAEAFRAGYRAGQNELIAETQEEGRLNAWIAEQEAQAFPRNSITDMDIYPPGCAS